MGGPCVAGIDVGASATKVVLLDAAGTLMAHAARSSGMDFTAASDLAFADALEAAGLRDADLTRVVATGYGRKNVARADATRTEIACHARGAHHFFPESMTVVDIGGQDLKVIKVGSGGERLEFKMNRKCAAGTGAFLEEIARRIGTPMDTLERLAGQSTEDVELGSFCTVFSATEVLALVRRGVQVPDIVKAAFRAVVKRIVEMEPLAGLVVATGGVVAYNPIVARLLAQAAPVTVRTPPHPQFAGAVGAALHALDEPG